MSSKALFHKKYPLNLLNAVYTVSIIYHSWKQCFPDLVLPSVKGIKPFILFTGNSDSALRTALSRERRKKNLIFKKDNNGTERFDMNPLGQGLTRFYSNENKRGITLAVFQFSTGQDKQRYTLKEILRSFGFRMLVQNVYMSRCAVHEEIKKAAADEKLENNLFLFDTDYPEGITLEHIQKLYKVKKWDKELKEFKEKLLVYLKEPDSAEERFNRALYAGAANHMYNRLNIPPLPENIFPGANLFNEIERDIADFYTKYSKELIEVYIKHHGVINE